MGLDDILSKYGLPTLIILAIGYAMGKVGVWLSGKVFEPLVTRHIAALDQQSRDSKSLATSLDAQTHILERIADAQEEMNGTLPDLCKHTDYCADYAPRRHRHGPQGPQGPPGPSSRPGPPGKEQP